MAPSLEPTEPRALYLEGGEVRFQPSGRTVHFSKGEDMLTLARRAHVRLYQTCNGAGTCGKCVVTVNDPVSPLTEEERTALTEEQRADGARLACQVVPLGAVVVTVPETGDLDILAEGLHLNMALRPRVTKEAVEVPPPSLHRPAADLARLQARLGERTILAPHPAMLQSLPLALEQGSGRVTVVRAGGVIVAVEPGDTRDSIYGMAFDIGTTTVVGYLRDLNTGELVEVAASVNPQTAFGADVIARIEHASRTPQGLSELRRAIIQCLNRLIAEACGAAKISPQAVYDLTLAGNTTMLHLALGVPVDSIARAPYAPAVLQALEMPATDLWLKAHPRARVSLLPHVAAYVGADIVADLLSSNLMRRDRMTLLLDFGTNAEIVLGSRKRTVACAAAAGPCFEGGNISCGMRAARGAIYGVRLEDDLLKWDTIGDAAPAGLCGTGLIDLVALLCDHGVIDEAGKLLPPERAPHAPADLRDRVEGEGRQLRFRLAAAEESAVGTALYLTQRDIRELQAAKAAIAAGVRLLCERLGIDPNAISETLMAGAFGNSIRTESGIRLGLLPRGPHTRYRSIGNAAGVGAQMALLSGAARRRAERIAERVEYVELSSEKSFTDVFAEEMYFPPNR